MTGVLVGMIIALMAYGFFVICGTAAGLITGDYFREAFFSALGWALAIMVVIAAIALVFGGGIYLIYLLTGAGANA